MIKLKNGVQKFNPFFPDNNNILRMKTQRLSALNEISQRLYVENEHSKEKISSYFGCDVFTKETMRQYLSKEVYESVCSAIEQGRRIERKVADQVASGMKMWAMEKGATHYSHWFQPLNNSTAEKHDAFFEPIWGGGSFETFKGELLIQQEPDASSFPNGGLRNTFEARGYSAWDPSSPAFVLENTLCIPSIFVAYTGEALDYKTPLLKSLSLIDRAAVEVCQLFDKDVSKVQVTLGCEQEYFLVDEALYFARPDLYQAGRTLMGHIAAKDQQLDDHYFGVIPERVSNFMKDFEYHAYRLGIPLKTRHNEVAPNQFECAPMFEEANIAVDHNSLLMSIMRTLAPKHKLRVIFHEKPFKGVNGSGKHCNWALVTNTGVNLLSPGRTPKTNTQFLIFFVCTIKAMSDYGSMVMASIASESNSHRLGANEAPPSVMSVFTGTTLSEVLDSLESRVSTKRMTPDEKTELKLDIGKIPEILLDNTDRNRTSPFAFTGNRFEFRAAGSSVNCAAPLISINTAVANQLLIFTKKVDELIETGVKKDEAIFQMLRDYIIDSKRVRFEGNGYSAEWVKEAVDVRGLESINNVPEAFKLLIRKDIIDLFVKHDILTAVELMARYEINNEIYVKKMQIESRVMVDIAANHIIPTAINYQNVLIDNVKGLKLIFPDEFTVLAQEEINTIRKIAEYVCLIRTNSKLMINARKKWNNVSSLSERCEGYCNEVRPYIDIIRTAIDKLELIVDDRLWPLPKYRELFVIH